MAGIAIPRDEALEEAIAENERDLPRALVDSGPSTGDIVQVGVGLVTIAVAPEVGMAIEGTAAAIDGVGSLLAVEGELGGDAAAAENTTTVYRAVCDAEYSDALGTSQFNQGPNSLEGKWFADSVEGAQMHGNSLYGPGNYQLLQADVPNNAPSLFQQPNLDGFGPARYLDLNDLSGVTPMPVK